MGDFRITIEAIGGHGCGRGNELPPPAGRVDRGYDIQRCGRLGCPDCEATRLIEILRRNGCSVHSAKLEHWPVPGAAGTFREDNPGPIDDLLSSRRDRIWDGRPAGGIVGNTPPTQA